MRYSAEERAWLIERIPGRTIDETAAEFSRLFSPVTREQVRSFASNNKVRSGMKRRPASSIWNDERDDFFRQIVPGREESEIRAMFLERFGIELSEGQIGNRKTTLGVRSGTTGGRFVEGQVPPNKGKRQHEFMSPEAIERTKATRFKKGNVPWDTRPLGSEYVDRDGYVYIKVNESGPRFGANGKWKQRSHIVWERENGRELAPDEIVLHANGDNGDDRPENLVAVSKSLHSILNKPDYDYSDKETCEICARIAELSLAMSKKKKEGKKR